MQKCEKVI